MSSPALSGFALLLPGGGSSARFGCGNKLLADLGGMPVFLHSVRNLAPLFESGAIFMAVAENALGEFQAASSKFLPEIPIRFMPGGTTRTGSVRILAEAAQASGIPFTHIAIHDAARPMIRPEIVRTAGELCRKTGASLVCRKVADTLKFSTDGALVDHTVDRGGMWAAETPQMFRLDAFLQAAEAAEQSGESFTDDAQIMEHFSDLRTAIVSDPYPNPKITVAEDLTLCRALFAEQSSHSK